jgi:catecholate siderophore receptor
MSFSARAAATVAACVFSAVSVVAAQTTSPTPIAHISGTVVDVMGGVIPGAVVTLDAAGVKRTTTATADGEFVFENVTASSATLTVTSDLFNPKTVVITAPHTVLRVVLELSGLVEAVNVVAAATEPSAIAAMRTETPLRDVPQSITSISRELIVDQSMRGMADAVNYVPGVGIAQGEGHRDAPIFRGNTSTSDFFVDGLRDDTQYIRDLYNIERVEVIKGPNGMIFGRGGSGGVVNRVTRQANGTSPRELSLQGGSWNERRLTTDLGQAFSSRFSARLSAVYENSGSYRAGVDLERFGVNPSIALRLGANTRLTATYEFFHDDRTVDRGIPSYQGRPIDVDDSTFFGNTHTNHAQATVHAASSMLEHRVGSRLTIRNNTRVANYDKFYQNIVPGAVNATATAVTLTAYNNRGQRTNVFNQTDVVWRRRTGRIAHTMLGGAEFGRQVSDNRRLTGFFSSISPTTTSIVVPVSNPATSVPVEFRASATDANNASVATIAAVYAQDQIELTPQVQAVVGLRYDQFSVDLDDHRTDTRLTSRDGLVSPRAALIYKPVEPVSVYAGYSRSHLPRAGEQLASLTLTTQALEPENFRNYEVGVKWDVLPALAFTTAVYRTQHGNVVVRDALDPNVSHLVDGDQIVGMELELSGRVSSRWMIQGGYALQDGEIKQSQSATVLAGATLAQVPRHSFALWNKYDVSRVWGIGLGVISMGDRYVATDNTVVLPAFARVDGAVYLTINSHLRAHVSFENALNERYYWSAHSNNNITPGTPRSVRVSIVTRF